MPTTPDNVLTLADIAKHKEPGGASAGILEIMSLTNEILQDAPAVMCNNGTTHVSTLRDDIPLPAFRMLNQGTPIVKSALRQQVDSTGVMEAWNEVDNATLQLSTQPKEILLSESKAVIEGMAQFAAEHLFYGSIADDPAGFNGLGVRYGSLTATDPVSRNIIDAGGTGDKLTSIWLIQWGSDAAHLLYPEGTVAGVRREVFNNEILRDSNGDPFTGTMVHFYWYLGLAIRDWRRCVRIANVDTTALATLLNDGADTAASQKLIRLLMQAQDLLPNLSAGKTVYYMGRIPHTMLNIMASEKQNVFLSYEAITGKPPLMHFQGIPIRRCDSLLVGEPQVV